MDMLLNIYTPELDAFSFSTQVGHLPAAAPPELDRDTAATLSDPVSTHPNAFSNSMPHDGHTAGLCARSPFSWEETGRTTSAP